MMSTKIKGTFAFIGAAALLLPAVAGAAGDGKKFSRADFERCNQQAMLIAGIDSDSPAALPGAAQPGQPGAQQGTSGTGVGAGTGTSGTGVGAGTGTSGTGVSSGTGTSGTGVGSGMGTSGTGVSAGTGTMGADQELDRIVNAYRDCLQQAKQGN